MRENTRISQYPRQCLFLTSRTVWVSLYEKPTIPVKPANHKRGVAGFHWQQECVRVDVRDNSLGELASFRSGTDAGRTLPNDYSEERYWSEPAVTVDPEGDQAPNTDRDREDRLYWHVCTVVREKGNSTRVVPQGRLHRQGPQYLMDRVRDLECVRSIKRGESMQQQKSAASTLFTQTHVTLTLVIAAMLLLCV